MADTEHRALFGSQRVRTQDVPMVHQADGFIVRSRCWGCGLPVDLLSSIASRAGLKTSEHSINGERCPGSGKEPFPCAPITVLSAIATELAPREPYWVCDQCQRNSSNHRQVLCWPLGVLRRLRRG